MFLVSTILCHAAVVTITTTTVLEFAIGPVLYLWQMQWLATMFNMYVYVFMSLGDTGRKTIIVASTYIVLLNYPKI